MGFYVFHFCSGIGKYGQGCPVGGIVLDPFLGSGTTAAAAKHLSRRYIGIELNPDYCTLAKQRIGGDED